MHLLYYTFKKNDNKVIRRKRISSIQENLIDFSNFCLSYLKPISKGSVINIILHIIRYLTIKAFIFEISVIEDVYIVNIVNIDILFKVTYIFHDSLRATVARFKKMGVEERERKHIYT